MAEGFDLFKDVGNLAALIDDERSPYNAHVFAAIHFLQTPHAVLLGDGMVLVGQKVVGELVFLLELFLVFDVIRTDSEDDDILVFKCAVVIPEPAGFGGAAFGVCARVEEEDDLLS